MYHVIVSRILFSHPLRCFFYGSIIVSILSCNGSLSVDRDESPAPNLDVIVLLTKNIVQSFVRDGYLVSQDTCSVHFIQTENVPFVEHTFLESLQKVPVHVYESTTYKQNSVSLVVQPSRIDVSYETMFREGLFGSEYVSRVVTVELSTKIVQQPQGNVRFSGIRREQWRDTVSVSSMEKIESPLIKVTQSNLQTETLLEKFIEPLVILVATGIIIYLFYTVRS